MSYFLKQFKDVAIGDIFIDLDNNAIKQTKTAETKNLWNPLSYVYVESDRIENNKNILGAALRDDMF